MAVLVLCSTLDTHLIVDERMATLEGAAKPRQHDHHTHAVVASNYLSGLIIRYPVCERFL